MENVLNWKKLGRWLWLFAITTGLLCWVTHPGAFTPESIRNTLHQYESTAVGIYFVVSMLRGCFLIPGTPFVLAGILLFPQEPRLVFLISMLGMIVGSTIIYFGSDKLGFAEVFEKNHAAGIQKIRRKMEQHGVIIVMVWSFFPLVPTDLICYVAGIVRMNFLRFIIALTIGEAVLIGTYVLLGTKVSV